MDLNLKTHGRYMLEHNLGSQFFASEDQQWTTIADSKIESSFETFVRTKSPPTRSIP